MTLADPMVHRFTREQYRQMAEAGHFDNARVELLDGEILDLPAQGEPHVYVVSELNRWLTAQLPQGKYQVRCQAPLAAGPASDPEPDFAVVPAIREDMSATPDTAIFVIEVADSSLARDRRKATSFAAAGVGEYWIINLRSRVIEQHTLPRQAMEDPQEPARYAVVRTFTTKEMISCTVLPLGTRPVTEFLAPF